VNRIQRLLGTVDRSHQIIELGAGYNPVAPKAGGWRTHVVDHATREELRAKYADASVDIAVIEDVDTVWHGGPLDQAVPAPLLGQVDLIIASHVLEHIPDLIAFFTSASRLVRPGGRLSVALPDRRYCFDCYKPWTTTGDLLEAHGVGLQRHTLKTAFNHMAYSALAEGQLGWGPMPVKPPVLMGAFSVAADMARHYRDDPNAPYQDFHVWQFTPSGLQLILIELLEIGLIDWQMEDMQGTQTFEFFVTLRRTEQAPPRTDPTVFQARRHELLLLQLAESREQIDFMLGSTARPVAPAEADTDAVYRALSQKLAEQDVRLAEMAQTLSWLRALLSPLRTIWRTLRRAR
jgi:SAM-dependent methyltransferase